MQFVHLIPGRAKRNFSSRFTVTFPFQKTGAGNPMIIAALLFSLVVGWPAPSSAAEIVAHRGASYDAPENTLAAFNLAWQQGADAIEGDFYLTKDHQIVCLHDDTTKRTAGFDLLVADATLEELRRMDFGAWKAPQFVGERIPTLRDVLATVPPGKKMLIEVKCGPEIVPFLKQELAEARFPADRTVVISFQAPVIAAVKKTIPNVKALWLTSYKKNPNTGAWAPTLPEVLATLQSIQADGLDSNAHERIDTDFVRALRAEGYEFHVWTVDDPALARRMMELGADSITTNRPEFLRMQLEPASP